MRRAIGCQVIKPEDNVSGAILAVRHEKMGERGTEIDDLAGHPRRGRVCQEKRSDWRAGRRALASDAWNRWFFSNRHVGGGGDRGKAEESRGRRKLGRV